MAHGGNDGAGSRMNPRNQRAIWAMAAGKLSKPGGLVTQELACIE